MLKCLRAALDEVDARRAVARSLEGQPIRGDWRVMAIGKAAAAMTLGASDALGTRMSAALVVTSPGHVPGQLRELHGVEVLESSHPVPDARSLAAGMAIVNCLRQSSRESQWLFLLSGGASSLVEHLSPGITLEALQRFNAWALGAGLDITTLNRLRRRLSSIKGGGLARLLGPRRALALMISDVPHDDPRVIGSGLLHPTREGCASRDAAVITTMPRDIAASFARRRAANSRRSRPVPVRIVASNEDACRAAARCARSLGFDARLHRARYSGDTARLARRFCRTLLRSQPDALHVWGGESTVRLPERPGRGGRNQHLALQAALELAGRSGTTLLAAGTDGVDGGTEDAGAVVDGETTKTGSELGLDAAASLRDADSGTFLEECGALVHTGPTLTNVGDLVLGLRIGGSR